ncbi:prepilin peptidase [Saccharospirillum salsuginis]|uniref:Prepilin leader peptidase/N-methyltransferase n=1 Tax=Saccharospirillum salsuginis TaxID=418750 RepID=A0A918KQE8_9GAMM|nr:A24 family peptidase [Saccharospirillum salsuginis]GGX69417.1 type 4 prepilin-like proteins leader peptide-processing enzyme [Saccharospirillum salsuginis]
MDLILILQNNTAAFIAAVFVVGLLVGSFLNVVIYRVPVMMQRVWDREIAEIQGQSVEDHTTFNLIKPDSTCPHCGHAIRAWENIPVISYVFLKGRCSACKASISPRYPIIEALTAGLSGVVAWKFGVSLETAALLVFFWSLVALTMIDVDHQLLPDSITLTLLWLGLLLNLDGLFESINSAVIGAVAGYLSLWSVYWAFKLLTGKEGMGYGDFKLFAAFGAWFGWMALPLIILLSSLVGAVVGIVMIAVMGRDRQIPIPFGPYLCGAALVYVFWGDAIMSWYLGSFA